MNKSSFRSACCVIFFCLISITSVAQNPYIKLCLEAIDFEKQGKLEAAVGKYSEAIRLKPDDWTAYSYRAKVNLQRGLFEDAIADASKAVSLSPQSPTPFFVRASSLESTGQYDKAIVDYSVGLSKSGINDKDSYLTFYKRGRAYFSNKQFQESVNDFNEALSLAEKFKKPTTDIRYMRAQAFLELKSYREAVTDLDAYLLVAPDDIKAILTQGYAFLKIGDMEKARASAQKIIRMDPAKEFYFSGNRMLDIFDLGMRREKSLVLTREAQTLIAEQSTVASKTLANIKLMDAFNNLDTAWLYSPGLTKEDLSLKETIREQFFIVYPLLKTKPAISEQLRRYVVQATSATQERKYDEAIALWTTTLNISPYTPIAYYNRALLYEMKGLYRYGISDLGKYLTLMPDAADSRQAKDKIYEWEAKVTDVAPVQSIHVEPINHIESGSYSPGNFTFALAVGGSFGVQFAKNPGLAALWKQSVGTSTPDFDYSDKMPFLYSGDLEMTIKPVKRIGIGAFGKLTGGIGARTKVSEVKYMLNMESFQFGGLVRYYMLLNNGAEKPDLYIQYAFGKSSLGGSYAVATMDGLIYNYSYMKHFKGNAPYNSFGLGMGGKVGKHGYITLSLDYLSSKIENITYEVTTNTNNPAEVGSKGSLPGIDANYNGIVLKLLFGFCF